MAEAKKSGSKSRRRRGVTHTPEPGEKLAKLASEEGVELEEETEGEVDQALVEEAVGEIRKRYEQTVSGMFEKGNQGMLEIGRYVLDRFYEGDPEKAAARGRKPASLRALTEHPQMPIGRSQLNNAVRAASVYKQLEDGGIKQVKQLSASHVVELLKAAPKQRKALVAEIVDKNLTVRDLQDRLALKALPAATEPGDGRTKIPRPLLTFLHLDMERLANPERLAQLPKGQRTKYRKTLEEAANRIKALIKALDVVEG